MKSIGEKENRRGRGALGNAAACENRSLGAIFELTSSESRRIALVIARLVIGRHEFGTKVVFVSS
jgi:hypothetical protein